MPWTRRAEGGERGLGLGLGRVGAGARARAGVGARPPPRSASRRRPDAQTSTCASAAAAAALQAARSAARVTARANRQSSCTASWPAAARRTRPGPSLGSSSPAPALASSPGSRSQHPPAWVLATQAYPSSCEVDRSKFGAPHSSRATCQPASLALPEASQQSRSPRGWPPHQKSAGSCPNTVQ